MNLDAMFINRFKDRKLIFKGFNRFLRYVNLVGIDNVNETIADFHLENCPVGQSRLFLFLMRYGDVRIATHRGHIYCECSAENRGADEDFVARLLREGLDLGWPGALSWVIQDNFLFADEVRPLIRDVFPRVPEHILYHRETLYALAYSNNVRGLRYVLGHAPRVARAEEVVALINECDVGDHVEDEVFRLVVDAVEPPRPDVKVAE